MIHLVIGLNLKFCYWCRGKTGLVYLIQNFPDTQKQMEQRELDLAFGTVTLA
jgi:hypothetical protein